MTIETRLSKLENTLIPEFSQMTDAELENWIELHCGMGEVARLKAMSDEELRAIVES